MLALRAHISLVNVDYYSVPVKINGLKRVSIGIAGASPPGTYFTASVSLRVNILENQ